MRRAAAENLVRMSLAYPLLRRIRRANIAWSRCGLAWGVTGGEKEAIIWITMRVLWKATDRRRQKLAAPKPSHNTPRQSRLGYIWGLPSRLWGYRWRCSLADGEAGVISSLSGFPRGWSSEFTIDSWSSKAMITSTTAVIRVKRDDFRGSE